VSCLMLMARADDDDDDDDEQPSSFERQSGRMARRRSSVLARPPPLAPNPRFFPANVNPLSAASVTQLQCLAVAYKVCPSPTRGQLLAIAKRTRLPAGVVVAWFRKREALQAWLQEHPDLTLKDLEKCYATPPRDASVGAAPLPASRFPQVMVGLYAPDASSETASPSETDSPSSSGSCSPT